MREYKYVGPEQMKRIGATVIQPSSAAELIEWLTAAEREVEPDGSVYATYVIAVSGALRVADRRSEHVACAERRNVLAAGEIAHSPSAATASR